MSEDGFKKTYTDRDIASIKAANSKKPICRINASEQPTYTEIFNAFISSQESSSTLLGKTYYTSIQKEPSCSSHSRFQRYYCVYCLSILCEECYENATLQHHVSETKLLTFKAKSMLKKRRIEINETVETLRKAIRTTKIKMKMTKLVNKHRVSMNLKRRSSYDEEEFEELWIQEMVSIHDTRRKQKQHLDELLRAKRYFTRLSEPEKTFSFLLEASMLPEVEDMVDKLLKKHENFFPSLRNTLLRGLTLNVNPQKATHKITIGGGRDMNLDKPWGVCCNQEGEIFVADRGNHHIKVFRRDGRLLNIFGSRGNGPLQFENPTGIAIHPDGNIVVVDQGNNRLQIINRDGALVRIFGENLDQPMDVACNSLNEIVVTNEKGNCVHMYSTYGSLLEKSDMLLYWPGWPASMVHRDRRITPRGVCFTPDDKIAITDSVRNSIIIMDRGLIRVLHEIRLNPSERIEKLQSIACDQFCNFVTVDEQNRVHVFRFDGKKRFSFDSTGTGKSEFQNPAGVCILPDGSICVSETGNNRIHIIS